MNPYPVKLLKPWLKNEVRITFNDDRSMTTTQGTRFDLAGKLEEVLGDDGIMIRLMQPDGRSFLMILPATKIGLVGKFSELVA